MYTCTHKQRHIDKLTHLIHTRFENRFIKMFQQWCCELNRIVMKKPQPRLYIVCNCQINQRTYFIPNKKMKTATILSVFHKIMRNNFPLLHLFWSKAVRQGLRIVKYCHAALTPKTSMYLKQLKQPSLTQV